MYELEFNYWCDHPDISIMQCLGSTMRCFGRAMRPGHRSKGTYFQPEALHYLCPKCGKVWLAITPSDESAEVYHRAVSMPCPKHGPGWANFSLEELECLPPQMLRREFDLCARDPEAWRAFSRSPLTSTTQPLNLTEQQS